MVLAAVYVLATVLAVPGSPLTLVAGALFGVAWGTITVSVGSTLGASAAFLVGRFLARDWVGARVARNPLPSHRPCRGRERLPGRVPTRLSPIFPFNLLNYGYGLTRVRFRDYFFASWLGMLPATVLYVYLGSLVKNVADLLAGKVEGGTGGRILFFVGLAATVIVTILVTRAAKKAVAKAIPTTPTEANP